MRILSFADLHIGKKSSNSYFLDIDKKVIDIVCQAVIEKGIDEVVFLGDLIHNRSESTPKTLGTARYCLDKLNALQVPVIMILGNHDTYYNNMKDANYYRIFNGLFRNITFVEGIAQNGTRLYVGWMQTPEEEQKYKEMSKDCQWIFGHFEFKGAELTDYYKKTDGMENDNMNSYIFSGHIHQRSKQNKLHYIGAPYPQTWNGKNRHDYGYVIVDTNKEEIEYVDLGLYYYNEYKLQNLLMQMALDKNAIKKEMLNSDTKVIIDLPLNEKQLADMKIYLNTFQTRNLLVEKQEEFPIIENISYDKLALSSPIDFIHEYISGMKMDEGQKGRILEKVRTILNQ
jgi:DNA repair exonuclease SbcCD nuclease subunit